MKATNQSRTLNLRDPHATALAYVAGDGTVNSLTYAELDQCIDVVAGRFAASHAPGTAIGILAENSLAWIVAFYAIQRAWCVPVPISFRLPAEGVSYIVNDADAALLLTDQDHHEVARSAAGNVPIEVLDAAWLEAARVGTVPESLPDGDPSDISMMLYTSGSTGRPKGVELSHASHLWVIEEGITGAGHTERILIAAPLYHMNALGMTQRSLAAGQLVAFLPKFDAATYLRTIESLGITDLSGVPPMFAMMVAERELAGGLDLSSVETIYMSSAPASKDLFAELDEMFDHPRFVYRYGTTESGPIAFADPVDGRPVPYGSVGVQHPHVELRLVNPDGSLTAETTGTLQIRCPAMMAGYHDRPDVPSPITDDGFYHTKDVFRIDDDGFWFFVGREDDMFASGGENVYPRAVEIALESHPAVAQAVVVPVPDEIKGAKPVAFVMLMPHMTATPQELKEHSLLTLEPFAHPRQIWIVDEMPLASTNKIDRNRLAQIAVENSSVTSS